MNRIGLIGGGSWATAIAKILTGNSNHINWWLRNEESVNYIINFNHNPNYLSSIQFDNNFLSLSTDLIWVIENSDTIILAVPSAFLKQALKDIPSDIFKNKILVSAVKGVIPDDNLIVSDFITKYYNVDPLNIGVIGGPCHSEEVALERLSFLTFGFKNIEYARQFADFFRCRHINTRISDDVDGIEYAAILKNIFAIASGMSSALGYGDNFQAVLIANAIQEMKNFIDKVSPAVRDINQPVYLGDLLVTAYSQFSRNRTFGHMIGKGYSVKSAQLGMNMIAEGYFAVKCINMINSQLNVNMAITSTVYNIIYNGVSPKVGFKNLSAELN